MVSVDAIITQPAEPLRDDTLSAWSSRVLSVGRELGFLIVPEMRLIAWLGVAGATVLAFHYDGERPSPTRCRPLEQDKWQHCYVGCMIASWCPIGPFSASILAILKEVRDVENHGEFSWPDVFATLRGAWDCAGCESCELCCCERLGG